MHTEQSITQLLRKKYAPPEYAFLEQVHDKTGFSNRSADALAMSLWPSRGLELIGFEIKISRSDWLRELKDPSKAEVIASRCDRWYIVAPKGVVKLEELPATWGLIEASEVSLHTRVPAAPAVESPVLSREFLAAILRRAQEQVTDDAKLQAEYQRGRHEAAEHERKMYKQLIEKERTAFAAYQKTVQNFERESGVSTTSYRYGNIAPAVRMVVEGGLSAQVKQLSAARAIVQHMLKQFDDALETIEKFNRA